MSIKSKLNTLFLVMALIPLLFVSAVTFTNYKNSLEAIRISELQELASFKAQRIETYFSGLRNNIEITQVLYNISKNLPVLNRFAADTANPEFIASKKMLDGQLQLMQSIFGLSDIMLVNPEGKVVYSSNSQHYSKDYLNLLPDPQQKAFKEGKNKVFFSEVFLNKTEGKRYGVMITAPAFDFNGVFIGVIAFEVDMAPIYKLIRDVSGLGETGEVLVGKKIGNEVVFLNPLRHDPEAVLKYRVKIGSEFAGPMQQAVQGRTGAGQLIDYRGKKVIAAWQYIPSLDWGIVAKIDIQEAFADIVNLLNLLLIILLIIFVLSGIMAFSIARSISEPIKKLSKGVEIVGKGNLNYKVGTNLKDEIGQLSRTFDKMTRDLKSITASRDDLNEEITVRKQIEEALNRSNENLEQFAYVASHDLQEPLRVMASYSELLERRYKDALDKDANEFIAFIVDAAKRMQRLINDLLAYSRIGRTEESMEKIDCNELLVKVIESIKPAIEENKAVITYDKLPVLPGNENNFIRLFQNLIGNAIKFHGRNPPSVHISAVKQPDEWKFLVKDNGIGIEPQYKDRIFLIFQRLHGRDKYPGTGIGLAVCKKIVDNLGGRIWVESKLGKGSIFYFTVPAKGGMKNG